jgi:hypothetical protein
MPPIGKRAHQKQNQDDDQDRAEQRYVSYMLRMRNGLAPKPVPPWIVRWNCSHDRLFATKRFMVKRLVTIWKRV